MEQSTATSRINWNQQEVAQVAIRYLQLCRDNPKIGEGAALKEAQKLLPEDRQRNNLCGLSQVPRVAKFIAAQQGVNLTNPAELPDTVSGLSVDPETVLANTPTEKLIELLRAREPALFAQKPAPTAADLHEDDLIQSLAKRRPELLTAGAPTAILIELVLGRFFHAMALERQRLEEAVTTTVVHTMGSQIMAHLNTERAKFEQRLFDIQQQIRGLANGGLKQQTTVSAPAPEDKNAYMPIFLLAGGDRQDFQRLQAQMMNASIRLQKIDVSKPQHVSVPAHDRAIIWTTKLSGDLQSSIRGKVNPQKLMIHTGTFDELGPAIVREAQKVREAR